MTTLDHLAAHSFCTLLGAPRWPYAEPPSHFYLAYEHFLHDTEAAPWLSLHYELQREAKQCMYKLIHDIYCQVSGIILFDP